MNLHEEFDMGRRAADSAELMEAPPAHFSEVARKGYKKRMEARRRSVYEYVRERVLNPDADEDDGPEDYEEAADWFAAVFGRRPDRWDGNYLALWSQIFTHFTR
jgi:hypothetical protein